MERVWIRSLGYILTLVGVVWNRSAAAGVYNGAVYENIGNTMPVTGWGTTSPSIVNRYISGCQNDAWDTIRECTSISGHSYCNSTGVYCSTSSFFTATGMNCVSGAASTGSQCTYFATSWPDGDTNLQFKGCDSGYYRSFSGSGLVACQINASGYTSPASFYNCCYRCPSYSGGATNTGNNYWTNNCNTEWCWVMVGTGFGITNCRIYPNPSGKSFTDNVGTYTLPSGCPYIQ